MQRQFNITKNEEKIIEYKDIKTKLYESSELLEKSIRQLFAVYPEDNIKVEKITEKKFNIYKNDCLLCNVAFEYQEESNVYNMMIIDSSSVVYRVLVRDDVKKTIGKLLCFSFEKGKTSYLVTNKFDDKFEISIEEDAGINRKKGLHIYISGLEVNNEVIIEMLKRIDCDPEWHKLYEYLEYQFLDKNLGSIKNMEKLIIKKYTIERNNAPKVNEFLEIRNGKLEGYELLFDSEVAPIRIKKTYGNKSITMDREESLETLFKIMLRNKELIQLIQKLEENQKGKTKKL